MFVPASYILVQTISRCSVSSTGYFTVVKGLVGNTSCFEKNPIRDVLCHVDIHLFEIEAEQKRKRRIVCSANAGYRTKTTLESCCVQAWTKAQCRQGIVNVKKLKGKTPFRSKCGVDVFSEKKVSEKRDLILTKFDPRLVDLARCQRTLWELTM